MAFTNNRVDFRNNISYDEIQHSLAMGKGIVNTVTQGLELNGNVLNAGTFVNGGCFGQLGNKTETLTLSLTGFTGWITIKTTLNNVNSESIITLETTKKTNDTYSTTNIKYFPIYKIENGVLKQDLRFSDTKVIGILNSFNNQNNTLTTKISQNNGEADLTSSVPINITAIQADNGIQTFSSIGFQPELFQTQNVQEITKEIFNKMSLGIFQDYVNGGSYQHYEDVINSELFFGGSYFEITIEKFASNTADIAQGYLIIKSLKQERKYALYPNNAKFIYTVNQPATNIMHIKYNFNDEDWDYNMYPFDRILYEYVKSLDVGISQGLMGGTNNSYNSVNLFKSFIRDYYNGDTSETFFSIIVQKNYENSGTVNSLIPSKVEIIPYKKNIKLEYKLLPRSGTPNLVGDYLIPISTGDHLAFNGFTFLDNNAKINLIPLSNYTVDNWQYYNHQYSSVNRDVTPFEPKNGSFNYAQHENYDVGNVSVLKYTQSDTIQYGTGAGDTIIGKYFSVDGWKINGGSDTTNVYSHYMCLRFVILKEFRTSTQYLMTTSDNNSNTVYLEQSLDPNSNEDKVIATILTKELNPDLIEMQELDLNKMLSVKSEINGQEFKNDSLLKFYQDNKKDIDDKVLQIKEPIIERLQQKIKAKSKLNSIEEAFIKSNVEAFK